jgi:SH3 domain protein
MLRKLSAMFVFLVLCSSAWSAVHITDKLLAGIYSQPNVNSEPLKLLPSGTPVELKAEKDGFVNVVLVDGQEGWVEKRLLSDEKPANVRLLELQSKYRQQQAKLDGYEKELLLLKKVNPQGSAKNIQALKVKLKNTEEFLQKSKREVIALQEQNTELSSRLAIGHKEKAVQESVRQKDREKSTRKSLLPWLSVLLIPILLVAGRYWGFSAHDGEQRKKHGGFRV